jgi:ABC-2 type transport system ATP-binding protein
LNSHSLLETFALTKAFEEVVAVNNVNLTVSPGEITGLLGPNGAGKSTTIKMLSTLLRPTSGSAQIAGYDISKSPYQVRQQIGVIFQDSTLDNRLTGRENLEFHCMVYKVPRSERVLRIKEMLAIVGLEEAADRLVKTYSGGMKRRLEIARGLLHHPSILFLDEPTVGLDPQTRAHIWDYVKTLIQEYGMGVLMTTHYMEEAEHCQSISIIDDGQIIAEGSPAGLKATMEGDQIHIETLNDPETAVWLQNKRKMDVTLSEEGLNFLLPNGDTELARLLSELPHPVKRLTVHQPTLEDVFIRLTGRKIRDEESGARDRLRFAARRKGKI